MSASWAAVIWSGVAANLTLAVFIFVWLWVTRTHHHRKDYR